MDRRTFLGAATAGLALLWLPKPWLVRTPPTVVTPEFEIDVQQMVDELARINDRFDQRFGTYLDSLTMLPGFSRSGGVKIFRPDSDVPLLDVPAGADGVIRWVARDLDERIYGPIRLVVSVPITMTAYGRKDGERIWSTYPQRYQRTEWIQKGTSLPR